MDVEVRCDDESVLIEIVTNLISMTKVLMGVEWKAIGMHVDEDIVVVRRPHTSSDALLVQDRVASRQRRGRDRAS
jgi:hypothetical protein